MSARKYKLHDGEFGSALAIRLTSKASRNAIAGIMEDGTIKIHVTASPGKGKDNQAMIGLLAEVLGVSKNKIELVAGEEGKDKLVSILGMDAVKLTQVVRDHLN